MKPTAKNLSARISSAIEFHSAPLAFKRGGGVESGTHETLAKRLALPDAAHVSALVQSGRLRSLGPVHRNEPTGPHRFSSQDLDDLRREVLSGLAEQVIEAFDGEAKDLPAAVSAALTSYMKSLKDGTAAEGFTRKLPARARAFAYQQEEQRPGLVQRVATGAAVAGGLYAGASYLRGRKLGAPGVLGALKAGNAANVADVRKIAGRVAGFIRPRPVAATAAAVGMSAALPPTVTPARVRKLMLAYGRLLRSRTA